METIVYLSFNFSQAFSNYKFRSFHVYVILDYTWKPTLAKVTDSYSRCLSTIGRSYRNLNFRNTFSTKLRTFPWVSRVSQSKFKANWSRGSWDMIGQTNRQINRDYRYRRVFTLFERLAEIINVVFIVLIYTTTTTTSTTINVRHHLENFHN